MVQESPLKKSDLIEKVKRRLGYPTVKIELEDSVINDHIDYGRAKFQKWAVGQSKQEFYFTVMLSAGVTTYDLDDIDPGICEVLGYSTQTAGSIHTLFTMENYLYNQGMYDMLLMRGASWGYTLVSYHIARDFIETVKRYIVDAYNFTYHRYTNQLEIEPPPPSGGELITEEGVLYDSPGWILVRAYRYEGTDEDLYSNPWMLDYVSALCKVTLGRIRLKFANFSAVGSNVGLALDGDSLIAEGKEELTTLEQQLRDEEAFDGLGFLLG
jgi:hypothetical protein